MNYIIVEEVDLVSLAELVNKKITLGYVPCGSIVAVKFNYGQPCKFAQPMLKNS